MSGVPKEIPGFGEASTAVRLNPEFDALGAAGLTSESYFVLSRVDGRASLKELILMSGLAVDKAVGILTDLRHRGALLLPDESPESVRDKLGGPTQAADGSGEHATLDLDESKLSDDERTALDDEEIVLTRKDRVRVLAMRQRVRDGGSYFAVLGVEQDAGKRELKRAYFKLSKEFHPDRFYGKEIGVFGEWMATIFEICTKAYDTLSDKDARARYEAALRGEKPAGTGGPRKRGQTKAEHAGILFEDACAREVGGDAEEALRLFGAVIRLDPQPRYLRRAARCALNADQLDMAHQYAAKAVELLPNNPSVARLFADVHRAADRLEEAEKTLERAISMKNDNDVLAAELEEDLAAVRKQRETR